MRMTLDVPLDQKVSESAFPSPHLLAAAMLEEATADREALWIVYIDTADTLIATELLAAGSIDATSVDPMLVFARAFQHGARAVLTVHHHTSAPSAPSEADHQIWAQLSQAADLVGIRLVDHLVMGPDGSFYSLRAVSA